MSASNEARKFAGMGRKKGRGVKNWSVIEIKQAKKSNFMGISTRYIPNVIDFSISLFKYFLTWLRLLQPLQYIPQLPLLWTLHQLIYLALFHAFVIS